MVTFLSIVLAFVTLIMGMAILLQEPKQAGLSGSFGMGGDQMLGAGTPNPLSKLTGWLAVAFLVLCLGIGLIEKGVSAESGIQEQPGDTSGLAPAISNPDAALPGELDIGTPGGTTGADGITDGPTDGTTGTSGTTTDDTPPSSVTPGSDPLGTGNGEG